MSEFHLPYWVTFESHKAACVEAESEEAAKVRAAELTGSKVIAIKRIPYPATPRLCPFEHPKHGVMPAFCFRPQECRGTSCPQSYACTE